MASGSDALAEAAKRDWREAELSEAQGAMLRFAMKMTHHHEDLDESDVVGLREAGFDDAEVLTIVQIVGFFNYYNRMVDALGVAPEDWMREPGSD